MGWPSKGWPKVGKEWSGFSVRGWVGVGFSIRGWVGVHGAAGVALTTPGETSIVHLPVTFYRAWLSCVPFWKTWVRTDLSSKASISKFSPAIDLKKSYNWELRSSLSSSSSSSWANWKEKVGYENCRIPHRFIRLKSPWNASNELWNNGLTAFCSLHAIDSSKSWENENMAN